MRYSIYYFFVSFWCNLRDTVIAYVFSVLTIYRSLSMLSVKLIVT